MKKCAIFSCMGLGDGLIALSLANNLQLNGFPATLFHPFLSSMQEWFPHLPIRPFPAQLEEFDHYFFIYEKTPWMTPLLSMCLKEHRKKTTVLNPIATPNRDYPFWEEGRFDGTKPFIDNLYVFCKDLIGLPIVTKGNGIVVPDAVQPRRYAKRVAIHPMSSRAGKNWSKEKFLRLADGLTERGFEPAFILTKDERAVWGGEAPEFKGLADAATFICESGYMVGNDSGIGHLASCLGLPTVTICRSALAARFWRPAWTDGEVIAPSPWILNMKGLRWRDKHWQRWISVGKVLSAFDRLQR